MAFEYLQGWRLHNLPGQAVAVLGHPHRRTVFSDVHREPPVFQFVPIAFGPVTGHQWKEPGSVLFSPSLQVFIYIDDISPEPSLLQPECSQISLHFFIGKMVLTIFVALRCSLSSKPLSLLYRGPQNWTQHSRFLPLAGSTTLWCISHSSPLVSSTNLLRVHSAPSSRLFLISLCRTRSVFEKHYHRIMVNAITVALLSGNI